MSARHKLLTLCFVVATAFGLLYFIISWPRTAIDPPFGGDPKFTYDAAIGHRPSRNIITQFNMAPQGGGNPINIKYRLNNLGLVSAIDVHDLPSGPRILLIGDSHLMGVVNQNDNTAVVLEQLLRKDRGSIAIFNASSGYYSLYQYILRARALIDRLRPDILVMVVFVGNDLLELEDVGRPHLDAQGNERPPIASPPPQTTTERAERYQIAMHGLFWQGLNQAFYFADHPERVLPAMDKARISFRLARDLAQQHKMKLLIALLPPYDLVFPERAAAVVSSAARKAVGNVNLRIHEFLISILREEKIEMIDMLLPMRQHGQDQLFANDFHIFVEGHRLVARELVAPIMRLLSN